MIVVSGEALMDVYVAGDTPTGLSLEARRGGSPLNVAIGLARLGQPVTFFGALSTGLLGERLLRSLRDERVDTACTVRIDAPTTLGMVGLDDLGVPAYTFYGERAADRLLPPTALDSVPAAAPAYHFGSYAMAVEPSASTLRALIEREAGRSVIAYDPNVRPHVEPDLQRWRDVLEWMLPRTHLLKVSDEDLQRLCPDISADDVAPQWLAAGVALVVVTRGARGAVAWTAGERVEIAAAPAEVIDTVGAGDSFQAALLAALAERDLLSPCGLRSLDARTLGPALQFAARAAAVTCARRGADLPRRQELG